MENRKIILFQIETTNDPWENTMEYIDTIDKFYENNNQEE